MTLKRKLGETVVYNGEIYEIAGGFLMKDDQFDYEGRMVIAPKGIVYQIRSAVGNLYNVHESKL